MVAIKRIESVRMEQSSGSEEEASGFIERSITAGNVRLCSGNEIQDCPFFSVFFFLPFYERTFSKRAPTVACCQTCSQIESNVGTDVDYC